MGVIYEPLTGQVIQIPDSAPVHHDHVLADITDYVAPPPVLIAYVYYNWDQYQLPLGSSVEIGTKVLYVNHQTTIITFIIMPTIGSTDLVINLAGDSSHEWITLVPGGLVECVYAGNGIWRQCGTNASNIPTLFNKVLNQNTGFYPNTSIDLYNTSNLFNTKLLCAYNFTFNIVDPMSSVLDSFLWIQVEDFYADLPKHDWNIRINAQGVGFVLQQINYRGKLTDYVHLVNHSSSIRLDSCGYFSDLTLTQYDPKTYDVVANFGTGNSIITGSATVFWVQTVMDFRVVFKPHADNTQSDINISGLTGRAWCDTNGTLNWELETSPACQLTGNVNVEIQEIWP